MSVASGSASLLLVFLKYPEPGRVKTRLALGVGEVEAVGIYRGLVDRTLATVGQWLGSSPPGESAAPARAVWIVYDPPEKCPAVEKWLSRNVRLWADPPGWVAQSPGDLGRRLEEAFEEGFKAGYSAVCAIGVDCPGITPSDLEAAFDALATVGAVLGPAADGGYYLIGVKTHSPSLFQNIPWSSSSVLAATLAAAASTGMSIHCLRPLRDIDTQTDWEEWLAEIPTDEGWN